MKKINFNVYKDTIEKLSNDIIISDSFNFLELIFKFSSDWEKYNIKKATFFSTYEDGEEMYEVDIIDNICIIPYEILKKTLFKNSFMVGVYGEIISNNVLEQRNVTNMITFTLRQGAYFVNSKNPGQIEPSAYNLYLLKLKEIFEENIKIYNENSIKKIDEYNNNAKLKKEEIDTVAKEVTQNKTDIEEIERRVSASESNAKTSETNAKTSESNAQKSAENALQVLTNVTGIQEGINKTKGEIDTAKTSIDESVEEVNSAVTEATNQAAESKKQASIATTKANQTSADRTAVENAKNDVSAIKTSVEQTKVDTEQIKTDTQGIYNNTVDAKNEALEAKTEVENSLENERIESDKKYARAIESEEIVVDGFGQVELDEDGYMKEFSAEGKLSEITQDTREGYNKIKGFISEGIYNGTLENDVFTSVSLNGYGNARTRFESLTLESQKQYFASIDCRALNNSYNNAINILLYYLTGENEYGTKRGTVVQSPIITNEYQRTIVQFDIEEEIEVSGFLIQTNNAIDAVIELTNPMISEQNMDYEPYGVSPSLDYPSSFKNVVKDIEVLNCHENLLNVIDNFEKKLSSRGLVYEVLSDGSFSINGTSTGYSGVYSIGSYSSDRKILKLIKNHKYRFYLQAQNTTNQVVRAYFGKSNKNDFDISCFNDGISYKDYTIQEDYMINQFSIIGGTTGNVRENLIIKVWIIDITNRVPENEEYKQYNGYVENLSLSEGQFLGNFQGFNNYIENDKLKGNLKICSLNGNEDWELMSTEEKTIRFRLKKPRSFGRFDGTTVNYMCDYFKAYSGSERTIDKEGLFITVTTNYVEIYIRVALEKISNIENFKSELIRLYNAGTPVQILYVTNEEFEEDLSTENKAKINSLKVYKDINNIYSNCKIRFKTNRAIDKIIEENNIKERKISDSKYAKALKGKVEDKKFVEIYAENPNVENLVLKGSAITQKTRQGYNKLDITMENATKNGIDGMNNKDGSVTIKGTSTNTTSNTSFDLGTIELKAGEPISAKVIGIENINSDIGMLTLVEAGVKTLISFATKSFDTYTPTEDITGTFRFYVKPGQSINATMKVLVVDGVKTVEQMPEYEQYGSSPSFEHPSNVEATTEQTIDNNQGNIVNPNGLKIFNSNKYISTKPAHNEAPTYYIEPNTDYVIISNIEFGDAGFYGWLNGKITRLTTKKDSRYDKFVTTFNTGNNNQLSFYIGGFKTDTLNVYQTFSDVNDFLNKTQFMIIKSSFIQNGVLPEFKPYQGKKYKIALPEGQFNGTIGEHSDKIYANDKQEKIIKEIVLDGTENWNINSTNKGYRYALHIENAQIANKSNPTALCTHFNLGENTGTWNSLNVFNIYDSNGMTLAFGSFTDINSINEWKAILQEQYSKGTPIKVCYTLVEPEQIDLPKGTVPKIELMDDLNILSIDNGTMSFEYNKSLVKVLEEKDNKISELEKQVSLNGNYELIDEIVSTTEQQIFNFTNLKLEKAIIFAEVMPSTGEANPGEFVTRINNITTNIGNGTGLNAGKYGRYIVEIQKLTDNLYRVKNDFTINTDILYANTTQSRCNFILIEANELNNISVRHWNAPTGVGTKVTLYGVKIPDSEENEVQALNEVTEENVIEDTIINENIENNEIENV